MNHNEAEPSQFTRELLAELGKKRYRLSAWRTFMSNSWARSLEDISANPALTRSFLLSAGAHFLAGCGILALSLLYQPPVAIRSVALWLPWYAVSTVFVLTHLGMADGEIGRASCRERV